MRINNQWKLIDLDAACVLPLPLPSPAAASTSSSLEMKQETLSGADSSVPIPVPVPVGVDSYACRKFSTCYVPPEAIHLDDDSQQVNQPPLSICVTYLYAPSVNMCHISIRV